MPTRVLILSAGIGEGHDLPARMLSDGLAQLEPGIDAPVVDGLAAMGKMSTLLADDGSDFMFEKANWLFDLSYLLLARFPPTRAFARWLTHRLGHTRPHAPDRRVAARRRRVDLSGRHRGARASARQGPHRRPGRLGDHRPRGAALLGPPGRRPAPHHRARVGGRGPRDRARHARRLRARPDVRRLRGGRRAGGRARADGAPAGRGPDRGERRRLGGRRPARRRAGGARRGRRGDGRRALRPQRRQARRAGAAVRRRAAAAHARLHGPDARPLRGGRRADPLDGGPDGLRGAAARLPRHLLRLGRRAHPPEQHGLPALRAGARRDGRARPARRAARRARRAARRRAPRPTRSGRRPRPRCWR